MADIVLYHSVLGLRPVEHALADEWRAMGHRVTAPDLYDGLSVETYEDGFALMKEIGLDTIIARALRAAEPLPSRTVLSGVSMGAGMASRAWSEGRDPAGVLFLAGPADWPPQGTSGTPVQMHAARPEPFDDEEVFAAFEADNPGCRLEVFRYDSVGHYFLDRTLPDYDAAAATLCRRRCRDFLAAL